MNRYDQRLARAVYVMVLLAILAMVLAEGAVVYFALACLAAIISWPIAHGRAAQAAVPRWLISVAVLLALVFFVFEWSGPVPLALALAHFMIFVQVCKFFEAKRARDYGQLIVLSMLEMVVAAILSSSLTFGVILVVYLALNIYTLLLFHFKREMELFERTGRPGRAAGPAPGALAHAAEALDSIRSGRFWRMSATTGAFSLVIGVTLFLWFPRVGEGMLSSPARHDSSPLTGFTENPVLGNIGTIKESDELVMWVSVLEGGRPSLADQPLLLRGSVSWRYEGGQWHPLVDPPGIEKLQSPTASPQTVYLTRGVRTEADLAALREFRIMVGPMDSHCLFTPYPPLALRAEARMAVFGSPLDQTFFTRDRPSGGLRYSVWTPRERPEGVRLGDAPPARIRFAPAPERIGELARTWTAGLDDNLAKARAIQAHLTREYAYSLQMPEPLDPAKNLDPLEVFLFERKAGHCQYFASAMAVLCQQLNIPARMISGFKVTEYNPQADHYIVRQKHAHSWVEAYFPDRGWVAFDPTPGGDESFETPTGLLAWARNSLDYMNFKWQQRVLSYSRHDREELLAGVARAWRSVFGAGRWLADLPWTRLLEFMIGLCVLAGAVRLIVGQGGWPRRLFHRQGFRRQQGRLRDAGLAFWADLLLLLDRRRMLPAPSLTPLEVAADLQRIVPQVGGLDRFADSYYKVRYGRLTLDPAEQSHVRQTLAALADALAQKRGHSFF